jgi:hypothetical protein
MYNRLLIVLDCASYFSHQRLQWLTLSAIADKKMTP